MNMRKDVEVVVVVVVVEVVVAGSSWWRRRQLNWFPRACFTVVAATAVTRHAGLAVALLSYGAEAQV